MIAKITLGTRGSDLARAQTLLVEKAIRNAHPNITIETKIIVTRGDHAKVVDLQAGRKGLFTAEIERALLAGEVHGYVEDEPVPTFLALENPGVVDVPTGRPLLVSPAGFAVNKGDPDFLAFLNAWITAHTADTWLPTTASYWFESLRWRERLGNGKR